MLLLMEFMSGHDGDMYQEVFNGYISRWFELDGTEYVFDTEKNCYAYKLKDDNPPTPQWYVEPTGN